MEETCFGYWFPLPQGKDKNFWIMSKICPLETFDGSAFKIPATKQVARQNITFKQFIVRSSLHSSINLIKLKFWERIKKFVLNFR